MPPVFGLEPQAVGGEAVEVVENADISVRRGGFAGVDLGADKVERPLEPGDLQERKVVGGIGMPPIKLLADDLLDPTEAEVFRGRDGAHRLPAHEAGEDSLRALMRLGQERVGRRCRHEISLLLNTNYILKFWFCKEFSSVIA